jgi:hypothetical protein
MTGVIRQSPTYNREDDAFFDGAVEPFQLGRRGLQSQLSETNGVLERRGPSSLHEVLDRFLQASKSKGAA